MDETKGASAAADWEELKLGGEHLQTALREAALAGAAVLRFLATLGPQDRGAAVLERLMRIVTQFLEGAAQNLEGGGPAREGAPPSMARRARIEALDAIIAVLADEVDRIDQEEEFPETFKERREALASIIGILTREKASAADGEAAGGGRIRRVPVE